ncbi:MAG: type IV secretory system conjugative DNA transfer family protein [Lachnospiraceae bacterium]|jgi:type IV secretion system protein VirD4|nr:type IV secretory system conjugative DNA transfer family protein [Lachnospiraceae bacterium]MCI1655954.1 type IV secretory system conjugative DNA transfer family protein [Lachnospiraceae bacterium]MCI2194436.1 type IV secretory system conjugative DNA transfer family protein [Lachnospiraceae bacterium]
MDKRKMKKLLILNLPYFLVGLFATNLGEAWRLAEGADSSAKILSFFHALPIALNNPFPSFHPLDLLIGILCGAGLRLAVYLKGKNAKKYRHNVEYGSARWGTAKDIEPFIAPKFEDNVILTKTERLMMSNRPKNPANARNKNVLIIGGSGSGKTRFWLKPNLLQMHSSYVVTDPKGSIVIECGNALLKHGYTIKIFNTINFQKSMHYNPFAYIHSEKDILKLVTTLIANTKGDGKAGDEFWTKAETLLYCALIGYIHYEAPVEEQNFSTLIEFLNAMEVREDDEEFQNPVDLMFEALEKKKPNHFAVRQYKKYKLAAGKTAKSILISCGARLAPFDIQEVRDVTAYDELQLQPIEKTVIDRCVHQIYQRYFDNPAPENMPILEDLYDALLKQDEKEAHHVATALEIYVKGSLKLFNNRTNVDIQNRLVCFDIKELGNQLKKIGMLIVQDQVWGRVTANRSAGKSTRYYIDEFHLLLKEEQTATYSVEIWKRFRKWGGLPTGITQNVKDLLRSPEIANILENSDFIYMLNQASDDRSILAQRLNISPHQLSYVTNSGEGEGLLFYGNVILPFIDRFPTDLELYRIMTTKLNEVAQEKEA